MVERTYDQHLSADDRSSQPIETGALSESATSAYDRNGMNIGNLQRTSESAALILAGAEQDLQIVDHSGKEISPSKTKFRSALDGDPSGEVQQRIIDGMQRRIDEGADHKTSRWQDGAVTRVDHHDQSITYMDPHGDSVRQNADGSKIFGKVRNPADFDGHSSDPQLELERRVHNGDKNNYVKSETGDGRNVTYNFNDGTKLAMDRMTGKLEFTDKKGNSWTIDDRSAKT
ncbi:MAG: hypothetical protein K2Y39_04745 [Candidatus Obscuribacterales bacterium]|nr:hypothetical protein [Candidatus Obscuribacterales bacterium]